MQKPIPVDDVLAQAGLYSLEEEMRLVEELMADVRRRITGQQKPKKARRSILEFEGMDQESWKDVNVREYLNRERDAWNG